MSLAEHYEFLVIGSGPAGQKASIQCAKAGRRVAVIEQGSAVGGACVHRGTIPSKTLRENALQLVRFQANAEAFNFELRDDVLLATLTGRMETVIRSHDEYIGRQLERNGVARIHGRARFLASDCLEVAHVDGLRSRIRADVIIIATGSRPRRPPEIPVDHEHVLDSDSLLSMIYLPRSLTVLGSGVIASEYASIFSVLGVDVTMIDRGSRPLAFLDPELTDKLLATFERHGGRFLGERKVASVAWDGLSKVVTRLADGTTIETDKLLCALGRVANVEDLELANAGLAVNDRGLIDVDEHCQTPVPGIYAVGDVIGWPSLASSSMEQGRRAACHALGRPTGSSPEMIPTGIYSIPEMAVVGLTEQQVVERHGGALIGRAAFDEIARGQISGVQDGLLKLIADPTGRKLLGAAIVGEGATELIHLAQMALLVGWDVDSFVENIFNFPTFAEAYRVAALEIQGKRQKVQPVYS